MSGEDKSRIDRKKKLIAAVKEGVPSKVQGCLGKIDDIKVDELKALINYSKQLKATKRLNSLPVIEVLTKALISLQEKEEAKVSVSVSQGVDVMGASDVSSEEPQQVNEIREQVADRMRAQVVASSYDPPSEGYLKFLKDGGNKKGEDTTKQNEKRPGITPS